METNKQVPIDEQKHNLNKTPKRELQLLQYEPDKEEEEQHDMLNYEHYNKRKLAITSSFIKKSPTFEGDSSQFMCQAEKCNVDLIKQGKMYHLKHGVCEYHFKAPVVIVSGVFKRFCQQCNRFHEISEFDDAKRSCRKRLAGHNERRRKALRLQLMQNHCRKSGKSKSSKKLLQTDISI
ncbi:Squamosa promoter-binding-like protein [Thalictrum thalictroides]|uniref:Squamosa promoter-binding-like protein n=1 Tax=Thalictrum thalictroides TaxID=46969 RepID=A0A7J6WSF3_THATH|nr:Squamosa promoter-binding-like protein [Thalictrum thalictroides]